jgi:hypothetical protein
MKKQLTEFQSMERELKAIDKKQNPRPLEETTSLVLRIEMVKFATLLIHAIV